MPFYIYFGFPHGIAHTFDDDGKLLIQQIIASSVAFNGICKFGTNSEGVRKGYGISLRWLNYECCC